MPAGTLGADALHVIGTGNVMSQETRIIYDPATGALYFDADGSGAQAAAQFASLSNRPDLLQATDFTIAGP
jgi:Ca2+-binding RTX toxin-like protein